MRMAVPSEMLCAALFLAIPVFGGCRSGDEKPTISNKTVSPQEVDDTVEGMSLVEKYRQPGVRVTRWEVGPFDKRSMEERGWHLGDVVELTGTLYDQWPLPMFRLEDGSLVDWRDNEPSYSSASQGGYISRDSVIEKHLRLRGTVVPGFSSVIFPSSNQWLLAVTTLEELPIVGVIDPMS